jgi:hypothetical protein
MEEGIPMRTFLISALLFGSTASAVSRIQTDWSGGLGGAYPYGDWYDCFLYENETTWCDTPEALKLPLEYPEIFVDIDFEGYCVWPEDIDGDGDLDVAGTSVENDRIVWWENTTGTASLWTEHSVDASVSQAWTLGAGDIDGDGDADLFASQNGNLVTWWRNTNGTGLSWLEFVVDSVNGLRWMTSGDIDQDGDEDLVAAGTGAGVFWYENLNGLGTSWQKHLINNNEIGANCVQAADIDGDGDPDVVVSAYDDSTVFWCENPETGTIWYKHMIGPDAIHPSGVNAADIDGDGDLDAISTSVQPHTITWWESESGGTTWGQHAIEQGLWAGYSACGEDLDGDGDTDVLASGGDGIYWWENLYGSGMGWARHTVDPIAHACYSVRPVDMDDDGTVDALGSTGNDNDVSWWDLGQSPHYPGSGCVTSTLLSTGGDPDWVNLSWVSAAPSGTAVAFQVRASDVWQNMGPWSDTLWTSPADLSGILADYASVFQYKAILISTSHAGSPTLYDVTVTWTSLGAGEGDSPSTLDLLPVSPNPCAGAPVIEFGLASSGSVELAVFDITGRLVQAVAPGEYQPGWHEVQLILPGAGVYLVRAAAGGSVASERFVVLE